MPDDPDELFVIDHLLQHRPRMSVPVVHQGDAEVRLRAVGDDGARVSSDTIVTVDAMVEGIHWDHRLTAEDVGWKLVAVNASDVNAMGCTPTWGVMTIALPRPLNRQWVEDFARGMGNALTEWSIDLIGGDTTASTGPIMTTLTLAGQGEHIIGRSNAQVGDDIWITGTLGCAAAGFLLESPTPHCQQALAKPSPPMGLGAALANANIVHAMMDISDGLSKDLSTLCRTSGVGAIVQSEDLPMRTEVAAHPDALAMAVGFGEDYGLLFTAAPQHRTRILELSKPWGAVTNVGVIDDRKDLGARLHNMSWPTHMFSHFGDES